jgi:pimeloyl-ACP methyl ester carboxylesterase
VVGDPSGQNGRVTDIVLVHGAWHGSWCWRRVLPRLWSAGHRVVPVTLTGLGERAHQMSPEVTVRTHVADVVTAMRSEDCQDAVLVGHSYGGVVITGAADALGDAVGRLVYVDGVVPTPGQSWGACVPPEVREQRRGLIARHGMLPPPPASALGVHGADADWVDSRMTPQPPGVLDDPVHFDGDAWAARQRTFVDCTSPALESIDPSRRLVRSQPGWEIVELATGHDPMITAADDLAVILLEVAAR